MVMMSPQIATMNPAPAASLTSRIGTVWCDGAPSHHTVPVREVRLAAGAGFIVAICGDIMTMPGLPKVPSAENIRLDENGLIEGLF